MIPFKVGDKVKCKWPGGMADKKNCVIKKIEIDEFGEVNVLFTFEYAVPCSEWAAFTARTVGEWEYAEDLVLDT